MNSTNLTTRLQELEALRAKATQGEWCADVHDNIMGDKYCIASTWYTDNRPSKENAAVIAQAPSAVALARELYDLLKQAGEALEFYSVDCRPGDGDVAIAALTNLKTKGIL